MENTITKLNLSSLPDVGKDSGVRMIGHSLAYYKTGSRDLIRLKLIRNGVWKGEVVNKSKLYSREKLITFDTGTENTRISVNKDLKGGDGNPWLITALGIGTGLVSGGAGIMFSLATTAVSTAIDKSEVFARMGDEIWQEEIIGRGIDSYLIFGEEILAVHVSRLYLEDPFRRKKGLPHKWLINEERYEIILDN